MAHLPVNHPARPLLRVIAAAVGLYILAFGVAGLVDTWGLAFFDRGENWVLGLRTNPAFSLLSVLAGIVVFGGAVLGRNVDHFLNLAGGVVFLLSGLFMMTLLHTEANLLNFSMTNCTVSFLIGLTLVVAGLYGKTGSGELAAEEDTLRRGGPVTGSDGSAAQASPPGETGRSRPG